MTSMNMRTLLATLVAATALCAGASVASARDFDPAMDGNTSLSALPMRSPGAAMHAKKEPTVPAKYDSAFPVRDRAPLRRERGAI